jgi:hypothetical protein
MENNKTKRIKELIGSLEATPIIVEEAKKPIERKVIKEAEETTKDAFVTLDEVRKNLQDAQAALVINLQSKYQTLYESQLSSLYEQIDGAINQTIELTKTMKTELRA